MSANKSLLQSLVEKYAALGMFDGYEIVQPDSPGPDGDTPFHIVVYDGDLEAAQIMLPYIADINMRGDLGSSPLHYAAMRHHAQLARFLITHGASLRQTNDYGDTPLDYMERDPAFRELFQVM